LYTLNATSTTLRVTRHCMKTSQGDANSRQIQGLGFIRPINFVRDGND
jgi:hypothetical protein